MTKIRFFLVLLVFVFTPYVIYINSANIISGTIVNIFFSLIGIIYILNVLSFDVTDFKIDISKAAGARIGAYTLLSAIVFLMLLYLNGLLEGKRIVITKIGEFENWHQLVFYFSELFRYLLGMLIIGPIFISNFMSKSNAIFIFLVAPFLTYVLFQGHPVHIVILAIFFTGSIRGYKMTIQVIPSLIMIAAASFIKLV